MEAKKTGGAYFTLLKENTMNHNTNYSSESSSFSYMAWSTNKSLKKGSEVASLAELQLLRRFFSERISLSSFVLRSCHKIFVNDYAHLNWLSSMIVLVAHQIGGATSKWTMTYCTDCQFNSQLRFRYPVTALNQLIKWAYAIHLAQNSNDSWGNMSS